MTLYCYWNTPRELQLCWSQLVHQPYSPWKRGRDGDFEGGEHRYCQQVWSRCLCSVPTRIRREGDCLLYIMETLQWDRWGIAGRFSKAPLFIVLSCQKVSLLHWKICVFWAEMWLYYIVNATINNIENTLFDLENLEFSQANRSSKKYQCHFWHVSRVPTYSDCLPELE